MKVKFIEDVTVPASKNQKELRFKDGSIHDLSEPSAWRWVRRNLAVCYIVEEAKPTLKAGRPMMAETRKYKASETADVFSVSGAEEKAAAEKPKKVGRPKKTQNLSPSLVKKGNRKGGVPGWNDA